MTITIFIILLTAFATVTSVATEGVKKFLDNQNITYSSNIVVLIVAVLIGCGGTALYFVNYQIPFTALNSVYLALMGLANWLTAMVGYDKVKQAIEQFKK